MKKIKITEQQANLLKNLDKTKVLKVTQEQYNKILEVEKLMESKMDYSNRVTKSFSDALPAKTEKVFKNVNINEMYEAFINELYGITESDPLLGESNFQKLAKLMEACGMTKHNRIVKEKFKGDKKVVEYAICEGLYAMENSGSPYRAMERIEEVLSSDDIVPTLKKQLEPSKDNKKSSPEEIRTKLADIRAKELSRRGKENDEYDALLGEIEGLGIVGLDILNHEPFVNLPDTRDTSRMGGNAKLPSLRDGDAISTIYEKEAVQQWVSEFKEKYGEEPVFELNPEAAWFDRIKVTNQAFIDWQNRYKQGKSDALSSFGSKDEASMADAVNNTAPIGKMSGTVHKPNVADELNVITDEVMDVETEKDIIHSDIINNLLKIITSPAIDPSIIEDNEEELNRLINQINSESSNKVISYLVPDMIKKLILYAKNGHKEGVFVKYIHHNRFVYNQLANLKSDINSGPMMYEEINEETTAGSVGGQYDTNALEDKDMKGDTPRGSGPTWKKPAIGGGTEVKINDKCNTFPYCDQGPDAIEKK